MRMTKSDNSYVLNRMQLTTVLLSLARLILNESTYLNVNNVINSTSVMPRESIVYN